MEFVSETEEPITLVAAATASTRCLAMSATPMRERAAMDKTP